MSFYRPVVDAAGDGVEVDADFVEFSVVEGEGGGVLLVLNLLEGDEGCLVYF